MIAGGDVIAADITVWDFFAMWVDGTLARRYPGINRLKRKSHPTIDAYRFAKHCPTLAKIPVRDVTELDIERVMVSLPRELRSGTKRRVYDLMHRLFDLAIVPGRIRTTNPVTKHARPMSEPDRLFTFLLPTEFQALMRCTRVPLERRVLYALGVNLGLRRSSLLALRWRDFDLRSGVVTSLVSKTGYPVVFAIDDQIVRLLRAYRRIARDVRDDDRVVVVSASNEQRASEVLRRDLATAGVDRDRLFERGSHMSPIRFHDLRATFVTWALRGGRTIHWVQDRTGHLNGTMVNRYSRAQRALEDLKIDPFPDISRAIPELAHAPTPCFTAAPRCPIACSP